MRALVREGVEAGCVGVSSGLIYEPGTHAQHRGARRARGRGARDRRPLRDPHARRGRSASSTRCARRSRSASAPACRSRSPTTRRPGARTGGRCASRSHRIEAARAPRRRRDAPTSTPTPPASTVLAAVVSTSPAPGGHGVGARRPDDVVLASAPEHPSWEGRTHRGPRRGVGRRRRSTPRGACSTPSGMNAAVVMHNMSEDDVRTVLAPPEHDDRLRRPADARRASPTRASTAPSRASSGTTSRELGRAHARGGGAPDDRAPGASASGSRTAADRAPAPSPTSSSSTRRAIADVATYADPHHPPAGIARVFVNGREVVRDGAHTGARPGRALRRHAPGLRAQPPIPAS